MMRDKHFALIKLLISQENWVTAKQLSGKINISERSVKNYISEINYVEKDLIMSSRNGYIVDKEKAQMVINKENVELPETPEERVKYIITKMLTNDSEGNQSLDLYEMSEQIFVSYETVKKDIVKVRRKLKEFDLYVNINNSCASIEGKELNKRRLLSNILFEEFNKNILSLAIIQKAFPDYNLESLQKIIEEQCKEYHYFINDYAMMNLVLDIAISMERIKKNCTFRTHIPDRRDYGAREMQLSEDIAGEIERSFNIQYNYVELKELTVLLISHLTKLDVNTLNQENIVNFVGEKCIELVKLLLKYLNENYYIDMENKDFIIRFTMHIHNLMLRLKDSSSTKNPLTEHIKNSCPLIFDCSVGIANRISEITGYQVDEDEIAYIALHIGGNLETYESQRKKINCILLFPQYYDFQDRVVEKLQKEFSDSIIIKEVITSILELEQIKSEDLLISTIQVSNSSVRECVVVNPFLSERDISSISEKIRKIKLYKKKVRLRELLTQVSNSDFFCRNNNFKNQEEVIRYMVEIMKQKNYINDSFINEVFERERHSSTAFGYIAVPHSFEMNAYKTGMFVLLNDKPIPWGEHMVNIVILFAINRNDRTAFHEVFDNLVVLLLENLNSNRVLQCNAYEEFINTIINCVD